MYIRNDRAFSGMISDLLLPASKAYVSHMEQVNREDIYGAAVYPPVVLECTAMSMNVGIGDSESMIPIINPMIANCSLEIN